MPFKDRKKQLEYMKNYSRARYEKQKKLQQAIREGKFDLAKQILETKPSIDVYGRHNRVAKRGKKVEEWDVEV